MVGASTGSIGGGTVQAAEVSLVNRFGLTGTALISITLAARKGLRSGDVVWDEQQCGVAFVAKPG